MMPSLILPTLNAADQAESFLDALEGQSIGEIDRLLIDSTSSDDTADIFASAGFRIICIPRKEFDHGVTRQIAVNLCPDADIIIFMTQDSVLADRNSLQRLIDAFNDPHVGAAYGRQLPSQDASLIASHARLFNYPANSRVVSKDDIPRLGVKAAFISNSFAAYRRDALQAVGGFPKHCIVSEDTCVAAKLILTGWKIAYCADAQVFHSHNYNWRQEFQRYFDIGVFHAREPSVRNEFGGAEGEGLRFLKSEIYYLIRHVPYMIPSALFRSVIKYFGYRIGIWERFISIRFKCRLSMQKAFWLQERGVRNAA